MKHIGPHLSHSVAPSEKAMGLEPHLVVHLYHERHKAILHKHRKKRHTIIHVHHRRLHRPGAPLPKR